MRLMGVRLDKWLWAARFFKTRSLAADACDLSRVQCQEQPAKPAREVHVGTMLRIKTPGGEFVVRVLALSDQRGPAAVAQTLYEETPESKAARLEAAAVNRLVWQPEAEREGKPSKRDRRELGRLKGR